MIPLSWILILAGLLFGLGLLGVLLSTNAVRILICIELMLNAVNLNLVAFSRYLGEGGLHGEVLALFAMTVGAAEAGVGLGILVAVNRNSKVIDIDKINLLKW